MTCLSHAIVRVNHRIIIYTAVSTRNLYLRDAIFVYGSIRIECYTHITLFFNFLIFFAGLPTDDIIVYNIYVVLQLSRRVVISRWAGDDIFFHFRLYYHAFISFIIITIIIITTTVILVIVVIVAVIFRQLNWSRVIIVSTERGVAGGALLYKVKIYAYAFISGNFILKTQRITSECGYIISII